MKRIMVVDDSEESFVIVRKALGDKFQVTWAKSVTDTLSKIQNGTFDLIILDVALPDGDGFQLCARLQKSDRTSNIPIIFLTARTGVPNIVTGFSLGADDYIEKPFDPLELHARVEGKLNKLRNQHDSDTVLVRGDLCINVDNRRSASQSIIQAAQTT
jgi:DNA-binding response OmpR family regulator